MRIAIVAPSPNPFRVGDAENLWWGMLRHLNQDTDHLADLIKLPVREASLPELVAGYEAFSRLDLSGFDLVVSTKYPAWMVRHPNHVVYLQHRCRGYYDGYPVADVGAFAYRGYDPVILELLAFIERHRGRREALPEFFTRFRSVASTEEGRHELARHPGPVGRAAVHFLDDIGLARGAIQRYAAGEDYFFSASVFDALLGESGAVPAPRKRRAPLPRVTVLNAYSVHPPDSGGRYRLHSLYKALSRHLDVDLVTLGLHEQGDDVVWAHEGLRELRMARTKAHKEADEAAHASAHVPVYDITALENIELTPNYLTMLENSLAGSSAVVVSHPYMLAALRKTGYSGRFLHEAHNCEQALKAGMLPESAARARLLRLVEEAEGACCREAALTFATSTDDAEALLRQYGGPRAHMVVIPNGTDTRRIAFRPTRERRRLKRRLGVANRPVALFLASGHGPNLQSAERLFALAEMMPDVSFALVGSVADAFLHRGLPDNVWRVGMVSEEVRNVWLEAADVALNPVLHGGGTNLKLLDYFAAGTPVVSTEIGVRGTGVQARWHATVAPIERFDAAIREVLAGGPEIERMVVEARALVEAEFDWEALAKRLYGEMQSRELI